MHTEMLKDQAQMSLHLSCSLVFLSLVTLTALQFVLGLAGWRIGLGNES